MYAKGFAWRWLGVGRNYSEDNYNLTLQIFVFKDLVIFRFRKFLSEEWYGWDGGCGWGIAGMDVVAGMDGV